VRTKGVWWTLSRTGVWSSVMNRDSFPFQESPGHGWVSLAGHFSVSSVWQHRGQYSSQATPVPVLIGLVDGIPLPLYLCVLTEV
jgi:hypothetical protein